MLLTSHYLCSSLCLCHLHLESQNSIKVADCNMIQTMLKSEHANDVSKFKAREGDIVISKVE